MLQKLSPPIPSGEIGAKLGNVQSPKEILGCIELDAFDKIVELFESPPPKHLHIVVQVPPPREYLRRLYIVCLLLYTAHH